jgi:hypothetical protein
VHQVEERRFAVFLKTELERRRRKEMAGPRLTK